MIIIIINHLTTRFPSSLRDCQLSISLTILLPITLNYIAWLSTVGALSLASETRFTLIYRECHRDCQLSSDP